MFASLAPILFVTIWSTGFVTARGVVGAVDPQLFLAVRMGLTTIVLAAAAWRRRDRWPRGRRLATHLAAGVSLPGLYLCASWWAVQHGMPAGIMSLLGALQPLLIALMALLLFGQRLHRRATLGLAIGLIGVTLVLAPRIEHGGGGITPLAAAVAVASILAMAAATMVQHAHLATDPLTTAGATQNLAGTAIALLALLLPGTTLRWDGSAIVWAALAWSVLGLSVAALSLLAWMLRHQGATRVSALLLLVPPLAAAEAWLLFGERLAPLQLSGFALALGGVVLARRAPVGAAGRR